MFVLLVFCCMLLFSVTLFKDQALQSPQHLFAIADWCAQCHLPCHWSLGYNVADGCNNCWMPSRVTQVSMIAYAGSSTSLCTSPGVCTTCGGNAFSEVMRANSLVIIVCCGEEGFIFTDNMRAPTLSPRTLSRILLAFSWLLHNRIATRIARPSRACCPLQDPRCIS